MDQQSARSGRNIPTDPAARSVWIGESIPTLIWPGEGSPPHPAIISLHGAGGNRYDVGQETVDRLTSRGVTVVTIDAYLHGERAPAGFDIRTPGTFTQMVFLEIIAHTAHDLFQVVAYLRQGGIEGDRIGLRGGSMGGYIALAAVGMGLGVRAVLSVAGGADYLQWFPRRIEPDAADVPGVGALREHEGLVRQIDPVYHVDAFPPRPVLLIHGERDPISHIGGDRTLYHALAAHYQAAPQNCLFLTHAGEHGTPESIEAFGWRWLMRKIDT